MCKPKVSVCIPTYRYGKYISEAIDSVLRQTFYDFELLVVDDASDDLTDQIVKRYAASDARIRYIRHESNKGMVENWNYCLQEARGVYIKFLFGDDFFTSRETLAKMVKIMECDKSISLLGSSRLIVNERSVPINVWSFSRADCVLDGAQVISTCLLQLKNMIGEPSAVMFRKEQALRGFDVKYKQIVDLEMWFHLLEQGKYAFICEPLCAFRIHEQQQTAQNAKSNVSLIDTSYLYKEYLNNNYIDIWWLNKKYIEYNHVYNAFKSYLNNRSDKDLFLEIANCYGVKTFFILLPIYKIYKPFTKIKRCVEKYLMPRQARD